MSIYGDFLLDWAAAMSTTCFSRRNLPGAASTFSKPVRRLFLSNAFARFSATWSNLQGESRFKNFTFLKIPRNIILTYWNWNPALMYRRCFTHCYSLKLNSARTQGSPSIPPALPFQNLVQHSPETQAVEWSRNCFAKTLSLPPWNGTMMHYIL